MVGSFSSAAAEQASDGGVVSHAYAAIVVAVQEDNTTWTCETDAVGRTTRKENTYF
jgi:hypothetical protein